MAKIGLKLWNLNTGHYLAAARALFAEGVFDYVELYVVPDHVDTLSAWKELKIPFDVHAPHSAHGMNLANPAARDSNRRLYEETKRFADELDARYIVFHGGTDGSYREVADQLASFGDERTLIENKPMKPLPFVKAKKYVGSTPEEMLYIKQTASCGFCLDIGHAICSANTLKTPPYDFIRGLATLAPNKIHLSDIRIDTEDDEHLNYGRGTVDFEAIGDILRTIGDITIETNKKSKTDLEDFAADALFLRKLLNSPSASPRETEGPLHA